jgi:hypothetical protein
MRQFKLIRLETAELRLLIYHIRRKLLRNMLNSILRKMKRAQAKFQMCSAHLSRFQDLQLLKEWLTCFFSGLEVVFDYVCHNGSFRAAHVQGFLVGHTTAHVPTDL